MLKKPDRVCRRVLREMATGSHLIVLGDSGPAIVIDGQRRLFAAPRRKARKLLSKALIRPDRNRLVITDNGRGVAFGAKVAR